MEDQKLQPVPEVIDGNVVEETEINTEEEEVHKEEVRNEEDDDEEFYERIEAPKFVDFTKPYTFRTDDRYWFCSRVGCDQKHEEEINAEEISKNFVLRVLAARSPNIKLRKALNTEHSSIKCPQSAPAKPSKPRIPRLGLISRKNADPQSKTAPHSNVSSTTPVAKSRQVAAKYMTTPRNKMCHPNSKTFRSVQNTKSTTTVDVSKSRTVAKVLVFHSPKKAIILKNSVELHTPLTKICEGMKRLEIASQKKTLKGSINKSKPKKPETEYSSRKQVKVCKSEKKSKDLAPLKSTKSQNKKTPIHKCHSVVDVKPNDGSTSEFSKKEEELQLNETSDLSNMEDKENMLSVEDHSNKVEVGHGSGQIDDDGKADALNPQDNNRSNIMSNVEDKENMLSVEEGHESGQIDDDGKENASNPQDNNRSDSQHLGDKFLSKEHKKNKVVQTVMKWQKPKPTNIKPFRLRTDERGILREANMEKKLHIPAHEKEVTKDTSLMKRAYRVPKNEKSSTEQRKHNGSTSDTAQRQQRSMASLRTRTQRVVSPRKKVRIPGQQPSVVEKKSSKLSSDVVVANKTRAVSAARSTSRGKRPLTIAKEPNFHTSHLPRSCSKKIA